MKKMVRVTVGWNTGTRIEKPRKGKGSFKREKNIKKIVDGDDGKA